MKTRGKPDRGRVIIIAPHGSYRTAPFIEAAYRRGIDIVIASEGRYSLVSADADGLHLDLHDTQASLEAIRRAARDKPVTGIVGTDDGTQELASLAARDLGLPHNDPGSVRIARRKDLARARLRDARVPVPRHVRISLDQPLMPQLDGVTFPCVLKPLALSASRGVIRADNREQFLRACARIEGIIAGEKNAEERRHVLAEEFIAGFEVAVEGILTDSQLEILAIFDKPDPLDGPYFEETYYVTPSRLGIPTQQCIGSHVEAACRAYGLRQGPVHAECRVNADGIWIIEVAARTIGGLCSRLFRFGIGYGLEEMVLSYAVGEPLQRRPDSGAAGVLMIPTPKAGVLRRVEGVLEASTIRYVEELTIQVRDGYKLVPLPEGSTYLGFIFSRAPTPRQAETALRQAHAHLTVVVAPLWHIESPGSLSVDMERPHLLPRRATAHR